MCGEQPYSMPLRYFLAGSPPRVRGTGCFLEILEFSSGITPARAGNRKRSFQSKALEKDHPRACGEQELVFQKRGSLLGSPPRVRGTGVSHISDLLENRITPARAGNRRIVQIEKPD